MFSKMLLLQIAEEGGFKVDDLEELTLHDVECKIQDRMELLEANGYRERADELRLLMGWLLCDDDY